MLRRARLPSQIHPSARVSWGQHRIPSRQCPNEPPYPGKETRRFDRTIRLPVSLSGVFEGARYAVRTLHGYPALELLDIKTWPRLSLARRQAPAPQ